MSKLPNVILPSHLVSAGQSGPHGASDPAYSLTPESISPRPARHESMDSSSLSYSNIFDVRRQADYNIPYDIPHREASLFDQSNNRDPFPFDISTPPPNPLNSPHGLERPMYDYYLSSTPSPQIQGAEDQSSERTSRVSIGMLSSQPGHETSNMTPRRCPPPSVPSTDGSHHLYPSIPFTQTMNHSLHAILHFQGQEATETELKVLQRRLRDLKIEVDQTKSQRLLGIPPADCQERTRFREQKFCSVNRAGNALCAWHEPRRERRMYPPRMSPYRTLNCGCTYAEALFEESLSRNGVGSFWPGESARMDPRLRNGLLQLLERVYGYNDGDFERIPDGTWREGQDTAAWEQRARRPVRRERF